MFADIGDSRWSTLKPMSQLQSSKTWLDSVDEITVWSVCGHDLGRCLVDMGA